MSVTNPIIQVNNLTIIHGQEKVLDNVTFSVESGDYLAIIGPNGSGKTTLFKAILGFLSPSEGSVLLGTSRLGYVPQRASQSSDSFPATVEEVVESGRLAKVGLFRGFSSQDRVVIQHVMQITKIADIKNKLVSKLSGGQKQRVYIARALASEPELLLLDEPLTGVDISSQKEFYGFLKELNSTQGITILFISHDVDMVTEEAKSILSLNKKLVAFGPANTLDENSVLDFMYGKGIKHLHHNH